MTRTITLSELIGWRDALKIGLEHEKTLFLKQTTPRFSENYEVMSHAHAQVKTIVECISEEIILPIEEVPA